MNRTPIAQEIKAIIDIWEYIKLKKQQSRDSLPNKRKSLLAIHLTED
jgi:hypothetical protein